MSAFKIGFILAAISLSGCVVMTKRAYMGKLRQAMKTGKANFTQKCAMEKDVLRSDLLGCDKALEACEGR